MEDYKILADLFIKHYRKGLIGIIEHKGKAQIQLEEKTFEKLHTNELLIGYEYDNCVWVAFEKDGVLFTTGYDLKDVAQ